MLFFELFSLNLSRLFHCSVIKVLAAFCCRFLLTAVCVSSFIISCVQMFVNNFFNFFLIFFWASGEGGIWTLAPLLTTCTLSRGVPSASLGTSPNECCYSFAMRLWHIAERVGFEPTRPCGQTVFKTASLWPLRYLSMCSLNRRKSYSIIIDELCQ